VDETEEKIPDRPDITRRLPWYLLGKQLSQTQMEASTPRTYGDRKR
jgi:hypothetical protein